jgi:plasmid stabilization system protein ParE
LLAGNSQINLVADAARRWAQHQQSGPLRAQVRGVLRSGRTGVFVEARYVEFFGVPE